MRCFMMFFFVGLLTFSCKEKDLSTQNTYQIVNQTHYKIVLKPWKIEHKDTLLIESNETYTYKKTFARGYEGSNPIQAQVGLDEEIQIIFNDTISILHRNSSAVDHSIMTEQSWIGGNTSGNCFTFSYTFTMQDIEEAKKHN